MTDFKKTHILSFSAFLAASFFLAACSTGYQSSNPYPYSHINKPAVVAKPQEAMPLPKARNKPVINKNVANAGGTKQTTVGKGDTVYALSRRYDVSVRSIINLNGLRPPYLLKPGQKLKLATGSTYIVKKGDTVYGLSRINNILMSELTRINSLRRPFALKVGQKLKLPGREESKRQVTRVASLAPPKISGKGFMWPLQGKVLSNYGPKQAGYHNDGINIAAPMGSSVRASDSGIVVHASNKLKGYGNLILIKHQNGWVTAYAHTDQMLVSKGEKVNRGQVVAKVGSSGRVSRPQLHFEMRKGSRAVNPALYLRT